MARGSTGIVVGTFNCTLWLSANVGAASGVWEGIGMYVMLAVDDGEGVGVGVEPSVIEEVSTGGSGAGSCACSVGVGVGDPFRTSATAVRACQPRRAATRTINNRLIGEFPGKRMG